MTELQETRTENCETITLAVYCVPGYPPADDVLAAAWETAQAAAQRTLDAYGFALTRVEQVR